MVGASTRITSFERRLKLAANGLSCLLETRPVFK
jgi:hypothetical protein